MRNNRRKIYAVLLVVLILVVWGRLLLRFVGGSEIIVEKTIDRGSVSHSTVPAKTWLVDTTDFVLSQYMTPFHSDYLQLAPTESRKRVDKLPSRSFSRRPDLEHLGSIITRTGRFACLSLKRGPLREIAVDSMLGEYRVVTIATDSVRVEWQDSLIWIRKQ